MNKRKCLNCGADISNRNLRTKYCTASCRSKKGQEKYIKKNIRYDIQIKRDEVIKLKGGECYFCKTKNGIIIHHKSYKSNELSNLFLLCGKCHQKLHILLKK